MDVDRTYADDPFFANPSTRCMLQRILLLWSCEHADISYRQGMNELLAMILIGLRKDFSTKPPPHAASYPIELTLLADTQFLEHDAYLIFNELMKSMRDYYIGGAAFQKESAVQSPLFH